ncbi:hypothetical protein VKT23_015270 [Stygiomarasmius scandens]|uniref:Uncharacterized protein n=1 Tax=Marasmiellus scandens TaxID=2682957 RepID=A0ABR1J2E3_9AGAR
MPSRSSSDDAQQRPVPEIITYRLDDSLVYVKPLLDYNEAISLAIKEYPNELGPIPRHRITFTIQATMNGNRKTVRVSESAWERTVSRMVRGEVVAIEILPWPEDTAEAPPKYIQASFAGSSGTGVEKRSRSLPGLSWLSGLFLSR